MSPAIRRSAAGAGIALIFAATVGILLKLIPEPRKDTDYLVIGGIATFVAMAALFVVLITTEFKSAEVFFKRRKRP
jgi:hypothetical protein